MILYPLLYLSVDDFRTQLLLDFCLDLLLLVRVMLHSSKYMYLCMNGWYSSGQQLDRNCTSAVGTVECFPQVGKTLHSSKYMYLCMVLKEKRAKDSIWYQQCPTCACASANYVVSCFIMA